MKFREMKISWQLHLGLGVIFLAMVLMGVLSIFQTQRLWQTTKNLYEHPFTVHVTLGKILNNILAINQDMVKAVLGKTEGEKKRALADIQARETDSDRRLGTLYHIFLGPRKEVDSLREALAQWKNIRGDTLRLIHLGKTAAALNSINITGVSGSFVQSLYTRIQEIEVFAENRSWEFYQNANHEKAVWSRMLLLALGILLLLVLTISFILLNNILGPLKEMTLAANRFHTGQLQARSKYVSKNALGVLSATFNTLAETIQTEWRNKVTIAQLLADKNAELEQQKQALDKANQLQRSFFSHMSHELRTPLNAVITLAGLLHRRLAATISAEEADYLEIIERNGRDLLVQINDILDWSRFASGRMEVNLKTFLLQTCIAEIVTALEPQAREKGIILENRVGNELPALNSDPYICRHIFENLLGNALKFTETGQVEVTARREGSMMYMAVRDTGIGISPENLANIFEEYRQANNGISSKYGGSGLGLAIAKKYAGLLQGSLSAESTLGVGSTFTLRLPLNFLTLGAGPENEVNHGNE